MPPSDPMNPPTPTQKAEQHNQALYRQQQIEKQNAELNQQREQAPSSIRAGSPQETQVRQEAAKAEQQAMVEQNIHQIGSTSDQFASAREEALKTGRFDYGSVGYASKGTPASYVDRYGNTISRPQGKITGGGFTPGSMGMSEPIKISQAQLDKTNALRASQGLPPLESVATIQITKPTVQPKEETVTIKTPTGTRTITGEQALIERLTSNYTQYNLSKQTQNKPTPKPQQPNDLRSELARLQGKSAEAAKTPEPEAVPFLSLAFPIKISTVPVKTGETFKTRGRGATGSRTGLKEEISFTSGQGTEQVPYTSILDALQFVPIGGLGVKAGTEALRGAGSIAGKSIKTGGEIIPKGIKPQEEKNIFDEIRDIFSKPQTQTETQQPSMERISLGRGIGQEVNTGSKEGGISTGTRPSGKPPSETPKETPSGKSGQILQQLKKEKEVPTTKQEQKTNYLGQGQKQAEELTGKGGSKGTPELETIFIPKPPATKQGQRTEPIPIIPIPKPIPGITTPNQTPKPPERLGITDILKIGVLRTGGGYPIITPAPSLEKTKETTKQETTQGTTSVGITDALYAYKTPGEPTGSGDLLTGGLGSGIPGFLNKVSKYGNRENYLGNVPINDIVGVYKREEISYGRASDKSVREKGTNMLGIFSTKKGKARGI